ncbi:Response regulator containing CheY-like receiver, AAA-type ATPase, and DNA-binding domains [Desulfonatronum thiosulfatophilum]|uniref:Response regulator containing CheY-like receiver, AAA-type ATPase, and DNA-binding domains n=1 Tax=Desulfonatronum thiosulfatophilum TaxID=617002 RepID=A0A1G6DDL9_9BACT|nr:response regulator [Desulfonatronum thiosulfatophilum]SDB42935.1 Response regulator containing CheY-like receiver, AAA-type ATPase, and DNA-binding domains [Desulfonatronum thiosulfatophilum]
MPIITLVSAAYCREEEVARALAAALSLRIVEDREIIAEASAKYSIKENKFYQALFGKPSVFNVFTRDRERCVSCYKAVLAARLLEDDQLILGLGGYLVPRTVTHVLQVSLTADTAFRMDRARQVHDLEPKALSKLLDQEDASVTRWTEYLNWKNPTQTSPSDILISMDNMSVENAVELIQDRARRSVTLPTVESMQAVEEFVLIARIEAALAVKGHVLKVEIKSGKIVLRVDKNIVRPERLEEELLEIVRDIVPDREVEVQLGSDMFQTDVYRPYDFENPSKVLVVDDEMDFAARLSERLKMREMGVAVVTSGEEALELVEEDEPEVVILDLKMPEISGEEVLRMIQKGHPKIPVIILSGMGDPAKFQACMDMGAFACLQKPADFKELTETIRRAYASLEQQT